MKTLALSPAARAAVLCIGALCASASFAAADKGAYDQSRATAKATYDSEKKACDSLAGNAKDICVAEAKARRTRTEAGAEATWKGTPAARQHAIDQIAEADYDVAKERCDDKGGNAKDVCVSEAKAALTRAKADAKADQKGAEARIDAAKDKRDANYKVAAERCDVLAGDAKSACVNDAKARFGK